MSSQLPQCNNCGASNWVQFHEQETDLREEERFFCRNCDKEGSIFDGAGSQVMSGAFR